MEGQTTREGMRRVICLSKRQRFTRARTNLDRQCRKPMKEKTCDHQDCNVSIDLAE